MIKKPQLKPIPTGTEVSGINIFGESCTTELPVNLDRVKEYFNSDNTVSIEVLLPELNEDQREFLITGLTPKDQAFKAAFQTTD